MATKRIKRPEPNDPVLDAKSVCSLINVSLATLKRIVKRGEFPRPILLSTNRKGWRQSTVETWLNQRSPLPEPGLLTVLDQIGNGLERDGANAEIANSSLGHSESQTRANLQRETAIDDAISSLKQLEEQTRERYKLQRSGADARAIEQLEAQMRDGLQRHIMDNGVKADSSQQKSLTEELAQRLAEQIVKKVDARGGGLRW